MSYIQLISGPVDADSSFRYCPKCIAWAVDPDNARPPHHPLVATLDKKTFPPKSMATHAEKRSLDGTASPSSSSKKPRLSSVLSATPEPGVSDIKNGKRPKRQAAMNRPDYHALHHHIATPTSKWLELISNPKQFGVIISEGKLHCLQPVAKLTRGSGNFPRIPAATMTKAWLESSCEPSSSDSSQNGGSSLAIAEAFFWPEARTTNRQGRRRRV